MEEKKLHELIGKKGKSVDASVKRLLQDAPYSQVLHSMSNKDSADFALFRYDWSPSKHVDSLNFGDIVTISEIDILDKKSGSKAGKKSKLKKSTKPKTRKKTIKQDQQSPKFVKAQEGGLELAGEKPIYDDLPKASSNISSGEIKKSSKDAVAKSNQDSDLDSFTIWLNSLEKSEIQIEGVKDIKTGNKSSTAKKKSEKAKKKKKKKPNKRKDEIKGKIEDSITDKDDIASLSLAELYEKQGYFEKAIEMFEKLSLKIPQKSAFFAARIQKLKEKI